MDMKDLTSAASVVNVLRRSKRFENIWKRTAVKDLTRKLVYDKFADIIIDTMFSGVIYVVRDSSGRKG